MYGDKYATYNGVVKMKTLKNSRKDRNHEAIVEALRSQGALVLNVHQLPNCFDILVVYKGHTYLVEIKDSSKPPSKRRLTDGEWRFRIEVENRGVKYWIINSVEEALEMIGC